MKNPAAVPQERQGSALEIEQISAKNDRGAGDGVDIESLRKDEPRRERGKRDAKEIEPFSFDDRENNPNVERPLRRPTIQYSTGLKAGLRTS